MKSGKKKASGGGAESPSMGYKEYEQDLAKKNMRYTFDSNVNEEAEEKKRGGRTKRRSGGKVGLKTGGAACDVRMDRKPRKSGGRTGSNNNPLSSAHRGTPPKGHSTMEVD